MLPQPKSPKDSEVVMTQMLLPGESNALGAAFGGTVMGWIDICGAVAAQRHCRHLVVTASMDDLHFHAPIKVGWTVTIRARVLATFKTSMEVGVSVYSENPLTGDTRLTTSALLTFVALAEDGTRLKVPPLLIETEDDRLAQDEAQSRRDERIARRGKGRHWQKLVGVKPGDTL